MLSLLLYTNVVMGASAAGWTALACVALGIPVDGVLAAVAFAATVAFYGLDRLRPESPASDLLSTPRRTRFVRRHRRALAALVVAMLVVAVGLAVTLRPAAAWVYAAAFVFCGTYTARLIPFRGERIAWKQLPLVKAPAVATLWTAVCALAPAAAHGALATSRTAWLAVAITCLRIVELNVNDLRDVEGDRRGGQRTWPVLLGEARARRVVLVVAALGALAALPVLPHAGLAVAAYSAVLIVAYRRERDGAMRPFIEAQGIVAGVLAVMVGG